MIKEMRNKVQEAVLFIVADQIFRMAEFDLSNQTLSNGFRKSIARMGAEYDGFPDKVLQMIQFECEKIMNECSIDGYKFLRQLEIGCQKEFVSSINVTNMDTLDLIRLGKNHETIMDYSEEVLAFVLSSGSADS
jgi:hypothetical protein